MLLRPEESDAEPERAWLVDVSAGGVALRTPGSHGLDVDALVMIELPLGTSISRIKTRCRVVAISGDDNEVAHMEFLDDSDLFKDTLHRALDIWKHRDEAATFRGEWW